MTALMIIFGILMILGGIVCFATPLATTFGLMYLFMIFLFTAGIVFLIRSIAYRRAADIIVAILALIAGGFIVFSPQMSFVTEVILLYIVACWFIFRGIFGIVNAASAKKRNMIGGGLLALSIIVCVIDILVGVYSFIHPLFLPELLGIMAAVYFIMEGIDLIVLGCIGSDLRNTNE